MYIMSMKQINNNKGELGRFPVSKFHITAKYDADTFQNNIILLFMLRAEMSLIRHVVCITHHRVTKFNIWFDYLINFIFQFNDFCHMAL